jgi:integrase
MLTFTVVHCVEPVSNHALAAIKIFFRWAQGRRYVQHSPCEGMQTIKRQPRAAVYSTAATIGHPFGSIVQLCVLTGQRRSEIGWLRRSYVSGDIVTFPPSLTKNNRVHSFPISNIARAIIDDIPGDDDLLLRGMRGEAVFSGWSKQKLVSRCHDC